MSDITKNDDCISRNAAIEALNCELHGSIESNIDLSKHKREFQEFANMVLEAQRKAIRALPSVTSAHSFANDILMKHYEQGRADAIAEIEGKLMQTFNP